MESFEYIDCDDLSGWRGERCGSGKRDDPGIAQWLEGLNIANGNDHHNDAGLDRRNTNVPVRQIHVSCRWMRSPGNESQVRTGWLNCAACQQSGSSSSSRLSGWVTDAREQAVEISEGLDAEALACNEGVQHRPRSSALVAPVKNPVATAHHNGSKAALGADIVDLQVTVFHVTQQRFPVGQGVVDGFTDRAFDWIGSPAPRER